MVSHLKTGVQTLKFLTACQAGSYRHAHEFRPVRGLRTPHSSDHVQWPAVKSETCTALARGAPHTRRIAFFTSIRVPCCRLRITAVGVDFTTPCHSELVARRDLSSFEDMLPRFGKPVPVCYVLLADWGHLIVHHATVLCVLAVDETRSCGTAKGVL